MGSGKTHWGKRLSDKLGIPFKDLDTVIVEREGKSIAEIFSEKGEEYFRYLEKDVLEETAAGDENLLLSCGGGTPCFFNNIEFMKKNGIVIWLNTSIDVLQDRLSKERRTRPLVSEVEDGDLRRFIIRKLGERKMYYEQAHVMVNEESTNLDELIKLLLLENE